MNAEQLNEQSRLAINVLVRNEKDGKVSARALGLPEYSVISSDRHAAISELDRLIAENLSGSEIISLEIKIPKPEHPWQKFAGIYKDSDLFNSVLTNIEANRHQLNSQVSKDYQEKKLA
jgi:hypothetical protein